MAENVFTSPAKAITTPKLSSSSHTDSQSSFVSLTDKCFVLMRSIHVLNVLNVDLGGKNDLYCTLTFEEAMPDKPSRLFSYRTSVLYGTKICSHSLTHSLTPNLSLTLSDFIYKLFTISTDLKLLCKRGWIQRAMGFV
jgi:hypothetical protein